MGILERVAVPAVHHALVVLADRSGCGESTQGWTGGRREE